jgi:beta-glucosidase
MRVDYEGFASGDRTRIELPAVQQQLLEALAATGKPLVFINLSGSAMAFPWAAEHVGAIVQAWYPGQAGGTAVADMLLGRANPGGRLPVTFYRSTDDLPPFADYRMANRTYRYFEGRPLYAFGHGLSYTQFAYSNLRVESAPDAGRGLRVSIDLENTGARDGDEVVQVYVQEPEVAQPRAKQSLAGFQRVRLGRGEKRTVIIPISASTLRRWNPDAKDLAVPTGEWRVRVGASSADIRHTAVVRVE